REAARHEQPRRSLPLAAVVRQPGREAAREERARALEVAGRAEPRRALDDVARDAAPPERERDPPAAEVLALGAARDRVGDQRVVEVAELVEARDDGGHGLRHESTPREPGFDLAAALRPARERAQ